MMKNKPLQSMAFTAVVAIICYSVINLFIIEISFWKFLLIDGLFTFGEKIIKGFQKEIGYKQEEPIVEDVEE
jgi:hypothetical protein